MKTRGEGSNIKKSRRVALGGVLSATAVALSYLENILPSFIPLPASRVGLSNVVTMLCVSRLGFFYGLSVTLFKAFFALVTRGATAGALSLSGGILSLAAMYLLMRLPEERVSFVLLGVASSVFHNLGQLAASYFILGKYVFGLAPYLIISAVITGAFTGAVYKYTLALFEKRNYTTKT